VISAEPVIFKGTAANGQHGVSNEGELSTVPTTEPSTIRQETPLTSQPQSEEAHSTNPTTPSSAKHAPVTPNGDTTPVAEKQARKPAVPAVPLIAPISKSSSEHSTIPSVEKASEKVDGRDDGQSAIEEDKAETEDVSALAPAPQAWAKPKAWAGLFNPSAPNANVSKGEKGSTGDHNASKANTESLADALRSFIVESNDSKIAFLKPRGLVNTGNMCYMNSVSGLISNFGPKSLMYHQVLQVLVSCVPFYSFLDQVGKRAAHSFKSDTPLIDAM
jgi:ubiquitin carboxyl-terminal hydrolase 10